MKRLAVFLAGLATGWLPLLMVAAVPEWPLALEMAESQTLKNSPRLQAKAAEFDALQAKADSQYGLLWPKLSLEASWRYVSEVPSIVLATARGPIEQQLTDHISYSVGPMLSWNIWDSGGVYFAWKAATAALAAKQEELAGLKREMILKTRLAYFQIQLIQAQSDLLADSLQLAQSQYQDIQGQYQAGSSSRMDMLSSHLEVVNRERLLSQARTDLAGSLRDLLALTGGQEGQDLTRPAVVVGAGKAKADASAQPSVLMRLDSLDESLARLEPAGRDRLDPDLPQLQVLSDLAESALQASQALSSGHWPRIQVYGKTSLDYPNGPVFETIHQNTAGVNASWSLWEGNRVVKAVAEQQQNSLSLNRQKQQALQDLRVNWQKNQDRLEQLKSDQALNQKAVEETQELARLVYAAYRSGRSSYLDLQAANLKSLDAKTQFVRTNVQILIQLALLDSLSETKEKQP